MKKKNRSLLLLISSMTIFGTIGVFRRYIDLSSAFIAMTRGLIGAGFLALLVLLRGRRFSGAAAGQTIFRCGDTAESASAGAVRRGDRL